MAPKRRNKVVGSVVKTKVVQETVEVTTALVDDDVPDQQAAEAVAAPVVEEIPAGANVSGGSTSTVVHVEVTTPDGGGDISADVNVKQPKKRGRGSKAAAAQEDDQRKKKRAAPATTEEETPPGPPVSLQSQETQDPNEQDAAAEEEEEDAGGKKQQQQQEAADEEHHHPETPRLSSERKTKKTEEKQGGAGDGPKKQQPRRRRRLGAATAGGDAGMGGVGGYKRYVWRVLKQVHPELGVSGRAMQVLDMMMADIFERLADEAARLSKATGRMTLTTREVQSAVRLVLPGELGKHAISGGVKAISKYMAA